MGQKLKGREFVLLMSRGGMMVPVCCGRDLTISISSEAIEATKAPQSTWRSFFYGIKGFSVTFSGLVMVDASFDINDVYNAINNRTTLSFVTSSNQEKDIFFSGNVIITGIEVTGNYKDIMTYSVTALGDGPLNNTNPYMINILTDENGDPLVDENGDLIYDQESGDLLPIDLNTTC